MIDHFRNKPFHDIEIEKRRKNIKQPYYKGAIHILNTSSNRINESQNRQNKIRSIRLFPLIILLKKIKNMNLKKN